MYAANATSWIVTALSGAPLTENVGRVNSTSSSDTSRRWAAIFRAFSITRRDTIAVAAPTVGVERDA